MKKIKETSIILFVTLAISVSAEAQNTASFQTKKGVMSEIQLKRWSHLDLVKDSIPGMSVDKAYAELLKNKKGAPVIVGIIDSGVDIEHEDLKDVIWTNKKEIPNNGIDDDKNGYIDDIHGWNFLGNITKEHIEYERIINNKNLVDEATYQMAKGYNDKKIEEATNAKDN
jgi:cell wall-associated protease